MQRVDEDHTQVEALGCAALRNSTMLHILLFLTIGIPFPVPYCLLFLVWGCEGPQRWYTRSRSFLFLPQHAIIIESVS